MGRWDKEGGERVTEWKVSSNVIAGVRMYQVYHIIDPTAVDHSGNRAYAGGLHKDEKEAERMAVELNRRENERE